MSRKTDYERNDVDKQVSIMVFVNNKFHFGFFVFAMLAAFVFSNSYAADNVRVKSRANQANVVMQLVPDQVSVGDTFTAMIQVKNIGGATWSRSKGYHLAASGPNVWNIKRLELAKHARIAPDDTVTFKAEFTAPLSPGEYAFQWQMRKNKSFFGQPSPLVNVHVGRQSITRLDSEFVYQNVSKTMLASESHEVAIQFKNTSQTDWRAGDVFLVSLDTSGLVWAIDIVEMHADRVIRQGEFIVFRFNVQAPLEPGSYPFQWQLRHRRGGLFGAPSDLVAVDVR